MIAHWRVHRRRAMLAVAAIVVLVLVDYLSTPFPLSAMECPDIYRVLRSRPEQGSLAELPVGLGDGFGPVTPVDMRFLLCQTIHERPLVGGVTSRLPPNVMAYYKADPLIAGWLRLSGMRVEAADVQPLPGREQAGERLESQRDRVCHAESQDRLARAAGVRRTRPAADDDHRERRPRALRHLV